MKASASSIELGSFLQKKKKEKIKIIKLYQLYFSLDRKEPPHKSIAGQAPDQGCKRMAGKRNYFEAERSNKG